MQALSNRGHDLVVQCWPAHPASSVCAHAQGCREVLAPATRRMQFMCFMAAPPRAAPVHAVAPVRQVSVHRLSHLQLPLVLLRCVALCSELVRPEYNALQGLGSTTRNCYRALTATPIAPRHHPFPAAPARPHLQRQHRQRHQGLGHGAHGEEALAAPEAVVSLEQPAPAQGGREGGLHSGLVKKCGGREAMFPGPQVGTSTTALAADISAQLVRSPSVLAPHLSRARQTHTCSGYCTVAWCSTSSSSSTAATAPSAWPAAFPSCSAPPPLAAAAALSS